MSRLNVRNGNWFDFIIACSSNTGPTERWDLFGKNSFLKFLNHTSYLVDPASSHMLVSKIKPCMSKFKRFKQRDCGRLIISVIVYLMVDCYKDNRSNSRANTCTSNHFGDCIY